MSITLETVLGTTKPSDPNAVTVNRVGNLENSENNGPLSTANFARNLWTAGESDGYNAIEAEEISRYIVINRPENLGQILLDTHVKDEQEIHRPRVQAGSRRWKGRGGADGSGNIRRMQLHARCQSPARGGARWRRSPNGGTRHARTAHPPAEL